MTLADKLTASRLLLAPVFFIAYRWGGILGAVPLTCVLWIIFIAIELSDLLDGRAARIQGTVSSFGKIFDPFADVVARMTYFVCFALAGIMPDWAFFLILYREFSQLFLRQVLASRGVAMAARPGGKLKAVLYMLAGAASLVLDGLLRLELAPAALPIAKLVVSGFYTLAVVLSLASFADYLVQFRAIMTDKK